MIINIRKGVYLKNTHSDHDNYDIKIFYLLQINLEKSIFHCEI